ncbi:S-layer homology domain-containing protein [Cohnella sp. AR92]|uniref:S-layer homology domain-containing protein n=1 Tax=Cohnella sp. AR92 TaxID=648716 RepID=UPI00131547FB|nr:S-layer homology domain-containing protein [Cohnella sp. AR92]
MLILITLMAACLPSAGYAQERAQFTLANSKASSSPDGALEFTLNGKNMQDLYAYEAVIIFDPDIVELAKAESKLEGYFIPPKVDKGKATIAYTKIGKKAGEQGDAVLSILTFKRKKEGNANIKLADVKALDSDLKAAIYHYGTFEDLAGYEWARTEIEALAALGIIKGTSASSFSPARNISRADFVGLLVRAFQLDAKVDGNFDDVRPSDYYYQEVGIARKLGIALGNGGNKFEPRSSMTRQDMMVTAERALRAAGKWKDEPASDLSGFKDSGDVASYAVSPLALLVKKGIIQGYNGRIKPKDTATRAEAAVIVYRLLQ